MAYYFTPISSQLDNKKWLSKFRLHTVVEGRSSYQENSLNIEFNTQKEADENATGYCLDQGYFLEN